MLGYFADDVRDAYVALGLHPRLSYFAARSAAFGAVGPEVPTATFYVFAPWLLRKALPASWAVASPEQVQQARRDAHVGRDRRGSSATPTSASCSTSRGPSVRA